MYCDCFIIWKTFNLLFLGFTFIELLLRAKHYLTPPPTLSHILDSPIQAWKAESRDIQVCEPDELAIDRWLVGEGNGNPLWCSCLENPRDGGAWWAAVNGVTKNRTRLKRLSRWLVNHYNYPHCVHFLPRDFRWALSEFIKKPHQICRILLNLKQFLQKVTFLLPIFQSYRKFFFSHFYFDRCSTLKLSCPSTFTLSRLVSILFWR